MLWILIGALAFALTVAVFFWAALVETEVDLKVRTQQAADMAVKAAHAERLRAAEFDRFLDMRGIAYRLGEERQVLEKAIRQHRSDLGPPKNPSDADAALWAHG
jgi:hypothetical protein